MKTPVGELRYQSEAEAACERAQRPTLREKLGLVVELRALLARIDDDFVVLRETLDTQVNAAALLVDGSRKQQTDDAHAAAACALATLDDVRARLDEYRAMMEREGREER